MGSQCIKQSPQMFAIDTTIKILHAHGGGEKILILLDSLEKKSAH